MKGTYLFLADGFELSEALTTLDVLKRGGVEVETVSIKDDFFVTSSNGVTILSDLVFEELEEDNEPAGAQDMLIFPGGMPGSVNLAEHEDLMKLMKRHYEQGGMLAAICAAPSVVLGHLPVAGRKMTCYTGFEQNLQDKGAIYTGKGVEIDGQFITGKGAGLALEFGLAIVNHLKGEEAVERAKAGMML